MNGHSLGYIYGWGLALFALLLLPPLLVATGAGEQQAAIGFLVTALISGFIGGALIIALKSNELELKRREKILLIVGFWVTYSLLGAIPFEASGVITERLNAIFEATSGLTTTGVTVLNEITGQPKSIILWRAMLNWFGGFLTLFTVTFAIIRILGAERAEQELNRSTPQISESSMHLYSSLRLILPIYLGFTFLGFFFLNFTGIPSFDALCLTMSAISTGGFMPRDGSFITYGSLSGMYVLSFLMVIGSISVLWLNFLIKQEWSRMRRFMEPVWVMGSMAMLALVVLWLRYRYNYGSDFLGINFELASSVMDAVSLISTTGFAANDDSFAFIIPPYMMIMIYVGGGVLSTAGGLKVTRILLMFRQAHGELRSLIYPHEVRPLYLSNEDKEFKYLSTVWVIFGLSILLIMTLAAILGAYGFGLESALFASISTFSNCGHCYEQARLVHTLDAGSVVDLAAPGKIAMIAAMIIGRLEFLVAISLLNISFWRH
ncbi:MAG: trk system potassium uptake protein [Rhodomicrobium sp.]|nr:MAG: trk system potassium uptake protein [Rhodomicrobium sp.]